MAYLKNPTKEQLKKYKMTKREIFEEFDNLSEKELNKKNNKCLCQKCFYDCYY